MPALNTLIPLPESTTYAAVLDISGAEQEITDFMVRRACDEMDAMQQWPFAEMGQYVARPVTGHGSDECSSQTRSLAKVIPLHRN